MKTLKLKKARVYFCNQVVNVLPIGFNNNGWIVENVEIIREGKNVVITGDEVISVSCDHIAPSESRQAFSDIEDEFIEAFEKRNKRWDPSVTMYKIKGYRGNLKERRRVRYDFENVVLTMKIFQDMIIEGNSKKTKYKHISRDSGK